MCEAMALGLMMEGMVSLDRVRGDANYDFNFLHGNTVSDDGDDEQFKPFTTETRAII